MACAHHEERGQGLDGESNSEERGPPDDVNGSEGEQEGEGIGRGFWR